MNYSIKTRYIAEALHVYDNSKWKHLEVTEVCGNALGDVIIETADGRRLYYSTTVHVLEEMPSWRDFEAMKEFYKKVGIRG